MQSLVQLKFLSFVTNYSRRYLHIAFIFINSISIKITYISSLCSIALFSNANWIDHSQPSQSAINYFIEFKPGIYNQPKNNNIEPLVDKINRFSTYQINIIGISQSASSQATYNLALLRAETIKKELVRQGIASDRIVISGENENFVLPEEIIHGVFVRSSESNTHTKVPKRATKDITKVSFIQFHAGVYNKPIDKQLNTTVKTLLSLPNNSPLLLVGVSQSKSNLATESLAIQRAQTVADQLIANGIEASRISLEKEVTNNVQDIYLYHGVHIFAINHEAAETDQKPLDSLLQEINSPTKNILKIPRNEEIIQQSPETTLEPIATISDNQKPCNELNIQKGSLKKNIQREIADCGYLMGQWNFGTDEEYIDWLIPVAYKVNVDKGIFGILNIIEKNYQIRAHLHQLDKSIDFLPSINRTKVQGQ